MCVLAAKSAELMQTPELIEGSKAEFNTAHDEGFQYRALVGDRMPSLDYRPSIAE